jgi:hypothetical protein
MWLCKLKEVAGRASHKSLLVVLMVAFGDRKDLLQFLCIVHFQRKCTMRKNCKRDSCRGIASA